MKTSWKKTGVRGKPVYVRDWTTFTIEVTVSGDHYLPWVRYKDGPHAHGLGLFISAEAAMRQADIDGDKIAVLEAGRRVVRGNPSPVLGQRARRPVGKGMESF